MKTGYCLVTLLVFLAAPAAALADDDNLDTGETDSGVSWSSDEPFPRQSDEPGLKRRQALAPDTTSGWGKLWFRTELAFGWASLLEDPDMEQGYGGGLSFTLGFHRRAGIELGVFFAANPYSEELGDIGTTFLAGVINMGPVFHLLDPDGRINLTLDAGIGWYVIIPPPILQDESWTFGLYGGATLGIRIFSWLAVGFKVRYHIFNLVTVAGEDLRDIKALNEMGAVDRFELPFFVAFHY